LIDLALQAVFGAVAEFLRDTAVTQGIAQSPISIPKTRRMALRCSRLPLGL
jgi:hypothetical protein